MAKIDLKGNTIEASKFVGEFEGDIDVTVTAADVTVTSITTEGGTVIPAGNLQTVLQAIADLADPSGG